MEHPRGVCILCGIVACRCGQRQSLQYVGCLCVRCCRLGSCVCNPTEHPNLNCNLSLLLVLARDVAGWRSGRHDLFWRCGRHDLCWRCGRLDLCWRRGRHDLRCCNVRLHSCWRCGRHDLCCCCRRCHCRRGCLRRLASVARWYQHRQRQALAPRAPCYKLMDEMVISTGAYWGDGACRGSWQRQAPTGKPRTIYCRACCRRRSHS